MAARIRRSHGLKTLNLALQGGGTQGAFTWGVLDRLLEEESIEIGRVSGTSAGALNAAALATGWARDGRIGAKQNLETGMGIWDDALPIFAPAQVNPVGMAPLRTILGTVIDEEVLRDPRAFAAPPVFVNAVHVASGKERVFGPGDITADALLASACAPLSYQAVLIDGEAYWDGSYATNPSLWPLYEGNLDADILLIELTPLRREETPLSAKNIANRVNEVASIAGLVAELRALDIVNRKVPKADIRLHLLSIADHPPESCFRTID